MRIAPFGHRPPDQPQLRRAPPSRRVSVPGRPRGYANHRAGSRRPQPSFRTPPPTPVPLARARPVRSPSDSRPSPDPDRGPHPILGPFPIRLRELRSPSRSPPAPVPETHPPHHQVGTFNQYHYPQSPA